MSLKLYLVRHGETEYRRTGGYCGALDPELTPEGTRMAQALADAYRFLPWTAAYVSPIEPADPTTKLVLGSEVSSIFTFAKEP